MSTVHVVEKELFFLTKTCRARCQGPSDFATRIGLAPVFLPPCFCPTEKSPFQGILWWQRSCVGGECDHVFEHKLFNGGPHQSTSNPRARSVFKIIKLTHNITRRATGNSWNWTQSLQIRSVANRALNSLALTACTGEFLAFL